MSLLSKKLQGLVGQQVIVVMSDHRAFRGELAEFDESTVVLHDVVEGNPTGAGGGWEEPTVSTSLREKVVTWRGTFSQENSGGADLVRLKDAIIQIAHVLRVWAWDPANVAKPEHLILEERGAGSTPSRGAPPSKGERRTGS